jgi:hypothetical protein
MLRERHVIRAVLIGVSGALMQQWVGCNAVNGFAPQIFEAAGSSSTQCGHVGLTNSTSAGLPLISAGSKAGPARVGAVRAVSATAISPGGGVSCARQPPARPTAITTARRANSG